VDEIVSAAWVAGASSVVTTIIVEVVEDVSMGMTFPWVEGITRTPSPWANGGFVDRREWGEPAITSVHNMLEMEAAESSENRMGTSVEMDSDVGSVLLETEHELGRSRGGENIPWGDDSGPWADVPPQ
jgi:hypothetical protein